MRKWQEGWYIPIRKLTIFSVISGRLYSEMFEHLPDKEEYPDYYNVIEEPRSLSIIEVSYPGELHDGVPKSIR